MVRRSRNIIVLAMASISACAWLYWRSASQQQAEAMRLEPATQGGTTAISSEPPRSVEAGEVRNAKSTEQTAAVEPTDSTNVQLDPTPSTAPSAAAKLSSGANPQGTPSEMDGLSVPEGAPFPVAELIEQECASSGDQYNDCSGVKSVLISIEDEQRDTQWATSMESQIRAAVEAVPGLHIRALACRSTVCAVETDGAFATQNTWNPLSMSLRNGGYVRAYDKEGFRVQLWTFKRRR